MIRNYLVVAWRSLIKHKGFTAINIFGLSLSMSVCLLLILLIYDHYQYDSFHPKGESTYRIVTRRMGSQGGLFEPGYATSPLKFKEALLSKYSGIEYMTNLNHSFRGEIRSPFNILEVERSFYADESFFDVFGFELTEGYPKTALKEPFSVVLTEDFASKLFPKGDALGQCVDFEDHGNYLVTGILHFPGKTHMDFDALASFSTVPLLVARDKYSSDHDSWSNLWMNYNYLVLKDDSDKNTIESALSEVEQTNRQLEKDQEGYSFKLQKVTEIVPGPLMNNELGFALPGIALLFFGVLGVIVIITASINYANLSIARSLSRAKEIGIRKVNGASRGHIMLQFLIESILLATISLIFALGIYRILIDQFNQLWIFNMIGIQLEDTALAYVFFFIFSLFLGILTGLAPSFFVSNMDPVNSLKGSLLSSTPSKRSGFSRLFSSKKLLLGIQFSLSLIMLVSIFLLRDQANFLSSSDYGFDKDSIYYLNVQGHKADVIQTEFGNIPGVEGLAFTSHHPAVGRSNATGVRLQSEDEPVTIYHFGVDKNYIQVMGLKLVSGTDFPRDVNNEQEKFVVLNRLATIRLGFASPSAAINQILSLDDESRVTVIGVIEDYHWEPMMKAIRPLALRILPDSYEYAYLKMGTNDPQGLVNRIQSKWGEFDESRVFKGGFLNEEINLFYQFMFDMGGILAFISLVAIAITSLGFLGMVSFHLQTRTKEIGIRKILGASFQQLTVTMTRGFLVMLLITSLVAIPIAVFINGLWINQMAVQAPMGVSNIGAAFLIIASICILTILTQVWKNTRNSPTKALRSE